jgi:NADH-quinone oxidoreductase subunit N
MTMSMNEDPLALLAEILLLLGATGGLILGLWLPRCRQWIVALVAAAALVAALIATAVSLTGEPETVFGGTYAIDIATNVARLVIIAATLLVLCLSVEAVRGARRETEYYTLLLLASLGAVAMAGANDLMLLAAAYLVASVPVYALVAFAKDAAGTEAALKYYLMGSFLGVAMLVGITVLFGVGGATLYPDLAEGLGAAPRAAVAVGLVGVLAGLLFKTGAVPGHFWVPDVTQGSPTPVAAFVTTVPKIGGLVAAYRLLDVALPETTVDWPLLVAVIAAASMTLGNLAAFFQDDPKRLLAYSTISQVGYLLMAVAVAGRTDLALPGLLYYLAAYAVTNLGAFAVLAELPGMRTLGDAAGLFRRHPGLALTLVVCLLGLVGTPPIAVFVGKLTVFSAALDGGLAWLVVVAAVNTVASVFYYLRWIAPTFLREPADRQPSDRALVPAGRWTRYGAYTAAVSSLALGLLGGPALTLAGSSGLVS